MYGPQKSVKNLLLGTEELRNQTPSKKKNYDAGWSGNPTALISHVPCVEPNIVAIY